MAMEMTAVWKERKSRSPFPLFPHCLGKLAKTASFPHSHSFGDDLGFPSSPSSFNFNCNEKCSLHARYLLLPTCQFAQKPQHEGFKPLRCCIPVRCRLFPQPVQPLRYGFSVLQLKITQPISLDGCPMFAPAYMGRKRPGAARSNASARPPKGLWLRANGACMAEKGYLRD